MLGAGTRFARATTRPGRTACSSPPRSCARSRWSRSSTLLVFSVVLPAIGMDAADDRERSARRPRLHRRHARRAQRRTASNPTSALASGAVVSAVLAISLQSTLGNILGGVALQLDGSIHEGDWIQLENGKQGRVRAVRWRHTVVETRDWSTIIVPNSQLLANNIMILGKRDGAPVPQRMWVWFNVDFRFAPTRVIEVVTDAILDPPIENVADRSAAELVCMDFAQDDARELRDVRGPLLAHRSRGRRPDQLARARPRSTPRSSRAGIPLAVPAHTAFVELKDEERSAQARRRALDERFARSQDRAPLPARSPTTSCARSPPA